MHKALLSLAGLLVAPAAALVLPSPAQATATEECRTVVVNDRVGPDSGENGNDWATVTVDRTTKVCVVGQLQPDVTKYKATISDAGTFVTRPGDSPGAGTDAKLVGGFPGDVVGGFSATFTAKPAFESYTPDALQNAGFVTTSAWVKTLFADAVFDANGAVAGWGWTYTTCGGQGEKWVNAEAGNSGDITEKACPAPEPKSCEAYLYTGTQTNLCADFPTNEDRNCDQVKYRVTLPDYKVDPWGLDGPVGEAFEGEKGLGCEANPLKGAPANTPSTSSPPAGGSAGGLPVTGVQVGLIGGVGAALAGLGALALLLTARRRHRFEA